MADISKNAHLLAAQQSKQQIFIKGTPNEVAVIERAIAGTVLVLAVVSENNPEYSDDVSDVYIMVIVVHDAHFPFPFL